MAYEDEIEEAISAINSLSSGNGTPEPLRHAAEVNDKAPEFAGVLRRSDVMAEAEIFIDLDARATRAQTVFQRTSAKANAVCATACLSAVLLALPSLLTDSNWNWPFVLIGSVSIVVGGL